MNILFNKKILFSLLLSSSLLIQGAYAQEGGSSSNIYGEYNITTGSSHSTPELQVYSNGSVNVGNTTLSDGTGVLCIKDDTNNNIDGVDPHSTVSNIQKNLTVNIDGNFLNEETMNCNGSNDNEANRAKVKNNKGLFINQGNINVGQYATLTCGKFPGNNNTNEYDSSWYKDNAFITNHNNYGGIMNGNNSFVTNIPTFTYNSNIIGVDSNPVPSKQGTITFIPGAVCNDGIVPDGGTQGVSEGPGEIDGGTIDLTNYVYIRSSNNTANNTTDPTQNNVLTGDQYSLQFENGAENNDKKATKLKINIKNAKIELFTGKIKNSANTPVEMNKDELSILTIGSFNDSENPSEFTMQNMFENLTFANCRCQIPDDEGNGEATYQANGPKFVTNAYDTNEKVNFDLSDSLQGVHGDNHSNQIIAFNSIVRNKIITDGSSSGSNFDIVKKLFANDTNVYKSNTSPNGKKIYHEIGPADSVTRYELWDGENDTNTTVPTNNFSAGTNSLVLYSANGGGAGNKKTFSKLFNDYMNLNCYIDTEESTKAYSNDVSLLPLKLKPTLTTGDTISSNIFIQTSGNQNIKIDAQYTDGSNDTDIDKPLELVMKNPWIHNGTDSNSNPLPTYTGTLSRTLDLTGTVTSVPSGTAAAPYVKLLEKSVPHDDIDNYSNMDDSDKLNALVKKGLNLGNNPTDEQIKDYINERVKEDNDAKRTTKIVQEYDGPAFSNFDINHNTSGMDAGILSSTKKDNLTSSDILEYEVVSNNDGNEVTYNKFSANPLVADKFTIGKANATETFTVSGTDSSNILTQNFTVNQNATYNLKGHITVRDLKGSDL